MKTGYTNQENVLEEASTMRRTWWPSSQGIRDSLVIAGALATVVGVLWGIGFSMISGLENRLIDRIDGMESALSDRIDGVESGRDGRIDSLERVMVEGFKQTHQRMDRMEGRMDRIESAIENQGSPAEITPAVATPSPLASSTGEVRADSTSTIPPSEKR